MARLWRDRLPITVVRPFNYTGVGQSEAFLLPKIVAHFKRGDSVIELGNLDVWRDFGDVRSVAEAYRRLIQVGAAGVTVNVCSGRVHSLREVISMIEELAGRSIELRVNPAFVRANEVRTLQGSADRLRSIIGEWKNPPLRETLAWMMAAG
jgi:nucleoside-diphosphate-sugar epimerase